MTAPTTTARMTPGVTPLGHLVLVADGDAAPLDPALADALARAFTRGPGHALLHLGAAEVGRPLPPALAYWRDLGARFVTAVCTRPADDDHAAPPPPPPDDDLADLAAAAPLMPGAEYLTAATLRTLWVATGTALTLELATTALPLEAFLHQLNPSWNLVGKVFFNLAENKRDEHAPFAFLATFSHRLSAQARAQHLPLGQALRAYAGPTHSAQLLALLLPVQRAAERCPWLQAMLDAGELFHPLRWTAADAVRLLRDTPELERAGVVVRMPATWRAGRPARPRVTATVGTHPPSSLGAGALLDFQVALTLDGQPLTAPEIAQLLAASDGLALLRGQWVEVDRDRLARTMDRFQRAERLAAAHGLSFADAMRLLAGAALSGDDDLAAADADWSQVTAGTWLADTLAALRTPDALAQLDPGPDLHATLRPYQHVGVRWLHLLTQLGLGACLADDMGLGKTLQVLTLLLILRRTGPTPHRPSLLVAPASLLANWTAELARFTPTLRALVAHPSATPADTLKALTPDDLAAHDLIITSYGALARQPALTATPWYLVVLDEAQAIKNPGTRQTRAAKALSAHARVALTGTPIENRLGDLWSLFDFINPGLLGSAATFTRYAKGLAAASHNAYGPLRQLVRPYLLRRLKTDKSVIADLPDKTELKAYCSLSRTQAALYQQAVAELTAQLERSDGLQRRGLVLAALMRFKQICNHPSQWLGDGAWAEEDSGKWARLRELAEVIAAKQEKVLVFTQFREVTAPLAAFLGDLFGRPGLVLHGDTAVKHRRDLVDRFQTDESIPFFVLSLKAGGSGLNLTAATHVIHFDRWWNPAVENQATDRAFRIGQHRNVLVHKFICRGTVEEKIDALIAAKQRLTEELLTGGGELNLTELSDDELLRLVALDLDAAMLDASTKE